MLSDRSEQNQDVARRVSLDHGTAPLSRFRTIVEVARWRAQTRPDAAAFTFLSNGEREFASLSYGELDRRARSVAADLETRGAQGEPVLLLFQPGPDFVTALFGCLYAGSLAVPVPPPEPLRLSRTLPRLQRIAADAGARVVLGSGEILKSSATVFQDGSGTETVALETIAEERASGWQPSTDDERKLALLQYTSGSTGSPRGVALSHANLMHSLALMDRRSVAADGAAKYPNMVSWLPPYHDMGLIGFILLPVFSGRRVIIMSPESFIEQPIRWLRAIDRYRAYASAGPNFAYDLCVRRATRENCEALDLSCWKIAVVGAEPVRAETLDRFVETFGRCGFRREAFLPAYGLAEAVVNVVGAKRTDLPLVLSVSSRALEENRVEVCDSRHHDVRRLVGCGRGASEERIAIVDQQSHVEIAPGRVGEIWFRSPHVGQGYWNCPEDTQRDFNAHLAGTGEGPFLRTGDLGFLHDGQLFIVGRLKELIILGGRNYYPNDFEQVISHSHRALANSNGVALSCEIDGQERLVVVYEVRRSQSHALDDILKSIRREIAEEFGLRPSAVLLVPGGTLPKTTSGKPRRSVCRETFLKGQFKSLAQWRADMADAAADFVPPRTPLETEIVAAVAQMLGIERVGIHDNLFALGGDSLLATELTVQLRQLVPPDFQLVKLFERPTAAGLAESILIAHLEHSQEMVDVLTRLENMPEGEPFHLRARFSDPANSAAKHRRPASGDFPGRLQELSTDKRVLLEDAVRNAARRRPRQAIRRRRADEPLVLSLAEQRLWFVDQLDPGHSVYNLPVAARLTGPLETAVFEQSLKELQRRHETLRTSFPAVDGQPLRKIAPRGQVCFREVDLRGVPLRDREQRLAQLLSQEAGRPLDLAEGPLCRYVAYRLADEQRVLLLVMHHIISDGWSLNVIMRELTLLYDALLHGRPKPLEPLAIQYADFAAWQSARASAERHEQDYLYWKRQLADIPPVLELPSDRPRSAASSYEGATYPFRWPVDLSARVRQLARQEQTTTFVILLAAFQTLLSRYCRQDDVAVGTAMAGRNRKELENLIGFFVNTVVLRTDLSDDPTFRGLVRRVHKITLDAQAHQDFPFDKLVEQLAPKQQRGLSPLFNVSMVYQNAPTETPQRQDITVEPVHVDNGTSKYDLTLYFFERDSRLVGYAEYRTGLLDSTTVGRLIDSLTTLAEAAVKRPQTQVSRLPLVRDAERQQALVECRGPATSEVACCLHELFEERAASQPERAAIRFLGRDYSYGEVDRWANKVARWLKEHGVGAEQPVGVCLPRSAELVMTMLAVNKAGAAYLPLDPHEPARRLASILKDARCPLVIARQDWAGPLPSTDVQLVDLERVVAETAKLPDDPPACKVDPRQLAYVTFTSGSTGKPKGVLVEHRSIVNFVRAQNRMLGLDRDARVLQFFSPVFDGCIAEIFNALAGGGCLVVGEPATYAAPDALEEFIRREGITAAQLTPSYLQLLRPEGLGQLETIVSAGEALTADLVKRWTSGRRLFNAYGPTEAAVGACMMRLDDSIVDGVPIGRPLENISIYILDKHLNSVPIGVPGEICIGGLGVARGYLSNPEATNRSFVPDPFTDERGARMYRTGDVGRRRAEGTIEFLGRSDDQAKIRGHRVEPGEVAAALESQPDVDKAAVVVREDQPGNPRLVAYVVPRTGTGDGEERDSAQREHLAVWQSVLDETFRRTPPAADPTFHTAGWISSRTGRPFPTEEMSQWVGHTAQRILDFKPRRMLEIGCNTGLILFRVAPHCQRYVGTDSGAQSLDWLRGVVERDEQLRGHVSLLERTPDECGDFKPLAFDVIFLNSIVPYFPDIHYLMRVLANLEPLVATGGRIVLGNLLSLPLQSSLACSVELARAPEGMSLDELRDRVRARIEKQQELFVHPALFDVLTTRFARLRAAESLLQRGAAGTELAQYRYDAILHFDVAAPSDDSVAIDFTPERWSPDRFAEYLCDGAPANVTLRGVPNARLSGDLVAQKLLAKPDGLASVGELRAAVSQLQDAAAVDPEEFWRSTAQTDRSLRIRWSASQEGGRYDVLAQRQPAGTLAHDPPAPDRDRLSKVHETSLHLNQYANDPMGTSMRRRLASNLRRYLADRLPPYMIPAAYVMLDSLPRTRQGKLDRSALPPPAGNRPEWSGDYAAPRDPMEALVADVWETVLGVSPIGVSDNFFELGGHSMLAVRMVAAIQQRTGRRLPLIALFQQPTVEHLARLLREPDTCGGESSLVTLQSKGSGTPLFAVHPAGGTVFCYQALARYLGRERPFYAIQALGVDGLQPAHDNVDQMVAHYVAAIRGVQPHGPYLLSGWSLGGNVAFEIARRLAEQGEPIRLLALFDSGAMPPDREPNEEDFLPVIMGLFPGDDDITLEQLRQMSAEEHLEYFYQRAVKSGIAGSDSDREAARRLLDVFKANLMAMWEYRPQPYPGKITLFASEQQPQRVDIARDPYLGWGDWARDGVEVHRIPGRHFDVIKEPNVRILAEKLRRCIAKAEAPNIPPIGP